MADNRLFSPPGVVAMGNALSSRMSRSNLWVIDKGMQSFKKIYLEIMKLNRFLPSTFSYGMPYEYMALTGYYLLSVTSVDAIMH